MSHYAKVENNKVVEVIVAEEDFFETFIDSSPGQWIKTSYNTRGNVHYLPDSNTPSGNSPLRGNYAAKGYNYDPINDVFYPNSPYPSWVLSTTTWLWEAPIKYPTDGKKYVWNEEMKNWIEEKIEE